MSRKKTKKTASAITYHFNVGVTVDAKGEVPEARYEAGEQVRAEDLPAHADLQGLIRVGAVRPVEDID